MPLTTPGLDVLASDRLDANAATSDVIGFEPRDFLVLDIGIAGCAAADIPALRLGVADVVISAASYTDRHTWVAGATASGGAGGTTWTNTQTVSSTMIRLGHAALTTPRVAQVIVLNLPGAVLTHPALILTNGGTAGAGFVGVPDTPVAEFTNTAQIVSAQLLTAAGQSLLAGSGFTVRGRNFG